MNLLEKKRQIVHTIEGVQEEWLIRAIEKLLGIDDNGESPDWHIPMVKERLENYIANPKDVVRWEDIKKRWKDEL